MKLENLTKEELATLRNRIPNGIRKTIARRTGFSVSYVDKVLSGKRSITVANCKIIAVALQEAKKAEKKICEIKKELQDGR